MTKQTKATHGFDYAAAKSRLDEIVSLLQSNDVSIDAALELHKEGAELVGQIEAYLQAAEVSVRKLELGE